MSTILKALRRLEQEKTARADRPLGEAVASAVPLPAAAASRSWPLVAGIAIGIVVLGVAAFAAFQWSRSGAVRAPVEIAAVPVQPEAELEPARVPAAPARVRPNAPAAKQPIRRGRNSLSVRARSQTPDPSAGGELPSEALQSDVAVVERSQPKPPSGRAASRPPAAGAAAKPPPSFAAKIPAPSPVVTPSTGESPVIDLSQIAALKAHSKAARRGPEPTASGHRAPTPPAEALPPADSAAPAPAPRAAPKPAPKPAPKRAPTPEAKPAAVEVAVARPAREPAPTPETRPKVEPKAAPKVEPKAEPKPPARSVARKSPPRPSGPPVPEVHVTRTIWHPDASRRTAYVKYAGRVGLVELHEGDSIGPLLVTKIAPTGVSFDNRGSELHRRVGAR